MSRAWFNGAYSALAYFFLHFQVDEGGFKVSDEMNKVMVTMVESQEQAIELVEKLFDVAQPGAVYGEPVTVGEHTVITASEVKVGMGFGYGTGGGSGVTAAEGETASADESPAESTGVGYGGGGGGGGVSGGRPVAVIKIGPAGVQVEPVFDATKIALAFFTTIGSMFLMLNRMRRASRR
jgi:uncharacterized spore protein YtfJ